MVGDGRVNDGWRCLVGGGRVDVVGSVIVVEAVIGSVLVGLVVVDSATIGSAMVGAAVWVRR